MTAFLRTLPLLLLLTLTACDSGDPDDMVSDVQIGGDYSATTETFSDGETVTVFTIPVTSSGETFSYTVKLTTERNGTISSSTSTNTGSYTFPNVTFTTDGTPLTGTVEENGAVLKIDRPSGGEFTFRR